MGNRKYKIFLTLFLLCIMNTSAMAEEKKLLDKCLAAQRFLSEIAVEDELDAGYCMGLIQGAMDVMAANDDLLPHEHKTCFPEQGIDMKEKIEIVIQFLQSRPESAAWDEGVVVSRALNKTFPCKDNQLTEEEEGLIGSLGFAAMSMDAYYEICHSKDTKINRHLNDVKELTYDKLRIFYSDVESRLEKSKNRNYYKESREYIHFLVKKFGGCKTEGMAGWFKVLEEQYAEKVKDFNAKFK